MKTVYRHMRETLPSTHTVIKKGKLRGTDLVYFVNKGWKKVSGLHSRYKIRLGESIASFIGVAREKKKGKRCVY